jgi:hypothetical protein
MGFLMSLCLLGRSCTHYFFGKLLFSLSLDTMSDLTSFQYCTGQVAEGMYEEVLECVTDKLEAAAALASADLFSWLLVIAGALVFFMQAGFAMLCGGCVRKKNLQNTMLKNLVRFEPYLTQT